MNWFPLLKSLLMTTAIGISRDKHKVFCMLYFYLWAAFAAMTPKPIDAGMYWYWFCVGGEVSIILGVLVLKPRVGPWMVGTSTINILMNCAAILFFHTFVFNLYPVVIRSMELTQCICLVVWSQPILSYCERAYQYLLERKGHSWMGRLLKQVLT